MTYCVGIRLDECLVFASDSRTHAGVDNFSRFCKMSVLERPGDRVIVMLSSGNLAGTQAVVSILRQRSERDDIANLWRVTTLFDAAMLVSDAMREVDRRDGQSLAHNEAGFNASFILGGQIGSEPPRLFRPYAEGNFIEAGDETAYLQTGETKYGKPVIDWAITPATSLDEAAKCVLVSFDSTMRSNLSVGMPTDLLCCRTDSLAVTMRRRLDEGDPYFARLGRQWSKGTRAIFAQLPNLQWPST